MRTNSTPLKLLCTVALLSSIFYFDVHAENEKTTPVASSGKKNSVNQLKAALKKANAELSAAQAKDVEQSRRIAQLEQELKNANPAPAVAAVPPVADNAQLQQELKSSKTRINELEEQLFVATDGKGVKGKEVAEELPEGTYPWTENMKRLPVGVLFPKTATIPKGDVYARFSHTSQNQTFATGGNAGHSPFF